MYSISNYSVIRKGELSSFLVGVDVVVDDDDHHDDHDQDHDNDFFLIYLKLMNHGISNVG